MTRVLLSDAMVPDLRRQRFDLAEGECLTVAEIVARVLPDLSDTDRARVRVTIGGPDDAAVVPMERWARVRPKRGALVCVRFVPGDPYSIGVALLNPLLQMGVGLNAAFTIASVAGSSIVTLGLSFAGAALANSLIPKPPKRKDLPEAEELYQVDGWQNQANPGEAIPFPVGRIRMAPLFASRPYFEVINGELYQYGRFLWGHGRLRITDLKLKDTPLHEFGDVVVHTNEGTPGDPVLPMTNEQVLQDNVGVELQWPANVNSETWASPRQIDRLRVIFQFPQGVFYLKENQSVKYAFITIRIWHRQSGQPDWQHVTDLGVEAATRSGFFRQHEWRVPVRGTWEVKVEAVNGGTGLQTTNTTFVWSFAGIREKRPKQFPKPLAETEVRIKASARASGVLDALNGVVERYVPVWNGTSWVEGLSRNPASIALAVLQSAAGAFPVSESEIHLDELADLHEFAAVKGLKYDRILSGEETMGEVLHSILSAARSTWRRDGEGWGVVIDRPQDDVVDTISPLHASSITWSRSYRNKLPDAFKVTFRDETNGWENAERIVPMPGFTGEPQTFEEWPQDGVTDPAQIWVETRREQYELIHRADTYTAIQSGEVRHATRGDEVNLSCDILKSVQMAARVRKVEGRVVTLDAPVLMEEGVQYVLNWQFYDETDTVGGSVMASVRTIAGETRMLLLDEGSDVPPLNAAVTFGPANQLHLRCKITSVEPAEDMAYRLTLQPAAHQIEALTDAEVPPAWVSIAGDAVSTSGTPSTPVIGQIALEPAEYDYSGVAAALIAVPVSMPSGNAVPVTRIEVSHRVVGAPFFTVDDLAGTSGVMRLGYPLGSSIEIFATAISVFGDPSVASAVVSFDVAGAVTLPTLLSPESITAVGTLGHAQVALATAADTAEVQLFRAPSGVALDTAAHAIGTPHSVASASSVTLVDGDATRVGIFPSGDLSSAAWDATDVTVTGGSASNDPGQVGLMSVDLAITAGSTYRGEIVLSGRTAGSVTVRLAGGTEVAAAAITADGAHLFALDAVTGNDRFEIEWSADCDATVTAIQLYRASATSAPQGHFDYYVAPVDADGTANIPAGPVPARII
ncbi:TipJ family phage tail tip protein [Sagittula sp. S175]|uniref:TipJ family phage tail tip protein n=1 Tax=Sagittula sp. S175 TaxID=3415129 RepID=UPI003C7A781D